MADGPGSSPEKVDDGESLAGESEGGEEEVHDKRVEWGEDQTKTFEGEEVEDVPIPDNFYYDLDPLVAKPVMSEGCELPENLLTLYHSFGYDCRLRANLHAIDNDRLIFAAGAYLQILDLHTLQSSYIRSTGGSIGAICMHPKGRLFAVGERGENPTINIFVIVNLRLYRILRGGTTRSFNSLAFNADGSLLASQGGDPDYQLTVWEWQQERLLLRCKSFGQDVYHVSFNKDLDGWLTTSGVGHIKFWNMAQTFTGLKLHGYVGRFGRTALSDIEGFIEFPDGKVLSGSEWGNLLLWDENLIKLQFVKKDGRPCHGGQVFQMLMVDGEILTAGSDGYVRCWSFDSVDQAEVTEEGGLVPIKPMNEVQIGPNVMLLYISRSPKPLRFRGDEGLREVEGMPPDASPRLTADRLGQELARASLVQPGEDEEHEVDKSRYIWYCQDGNGAIWKADLSFLSTSKPPQPLLHFHGGKIVGVTVSPLTYLAATIGEDGVVRLYDFLARKEIGHIRFKAAGTCITWTPVCVNSKCTTILAGFADGGIRLITFEDDSQTHLLKDLHCKLFCVKALKPHEKAVTGIAYDRIGEHLATCSEDKTVFFFYVANKLMHPMCYVQLEYVPIGVRFSRDSSAPENLVIIFRDGKVIELISPETYETDSTDTYRYDGCSYREFFFNSCKSQILHDEELEKERKEEEKRQKEIAERDAKLIADGVETPSTQDLRKEQERLALKAQQMREAEENKNKPAWKPYIPPIPNQILEILYTEPNSRFWLSMGGYDAGFLYECEMPVFYTYKGKNENYDGPKKEISRVVRVQDSHDVPITAIRFNSDGTCAFFGMEDGKIRLQFLENDFDLASPSYYWTIQAHDVVHGAITGMEFSHDESFLLTVGADGNFFVFSLMPIEQLVKEISAKRAKIQEQIPGLKPVPDLEPGQYTIEQAKQKADYDRMVKNAEKLKAEKRVTIAQLRAKFRHLWADNMKLPPVHRLTKDEFLMDEERVREMKEENEAKVKHVHTQLAWESEKARQSFQKVHDRYRKTLTQDRFGVKAFLTEHIVFSFRTQEKPQADGVDEEETEEEAEEEEKKAGPSVRGESVFAEEEVNLDQGIWKYLGQRMKNIIKQARLKRRKRARRKAQWEQFLETKPPDDYADPKDLQAIEIAKATLGDFKLKTGKEYVVPDTYKLTLKDSRRRLRTCEEHLHWLQISFNQRLLALRDEKAELIQDINGMVERLKVIGEEIAADCFRAPPPSLRLALYEQPEKKYRFDKHDLVALKKRMEEAEKRRQAEEHGHHATFSPSQASPPRASKDRGGRSSMQMSHPKLSRISVLRASRAFRSSITGDSSADQQAASPVGEEPEAQEEIEAPTPLRDQIEQIHQIELGYEQDVLHKTIRSKKEVFDIKHRLLRHEKFALDALCKRGDLRVVTLTEETLLMRDCESVEGQILARIASCVKTKSGTDSQLRQLTDNVEKTNKELEKCAKTEKELLAQLMTIIGEKNRFQDYLVKVYKKKIKRKVKKEGEEDLEEEESSSESSSEEDEDMGEEEDDDEAVYLDLARCPQGCDQDKYDAVVALREHRVDNDELAADLKKQREGFLKEIEHVKKKKTAADQSYDAATKELSAFQREKQGKINALEVITLLQLHQVQCLKNEEMPSSVADLLNINEADIVRLQTRISELKKELKVQRDRMKDSHKLFNHLRYERANFLEKLAIMDEDCNEAMRKKFGQVCDLETLEAATCDPDIEEMRLKLDLAREQCYKEMKEIGKEYTNVADDYSDLFLRIDTEMKLIEANLKAENITRAQSLDKTISSMKLRYEEASYSMPNDIHNLINLVAHQRLALQALTKEIETLSRGQKPTLRHFTY